MRDWGYAKEYVEAMWLMLQQNQPKDYVIATGQSFSIREFVEMAFDYVGINIYWKGKGINEKGYDKLNNECLVEINPKYFRPAEVEFLEGDPSLAMKEMGWKPKTSLKELVEIMVEYDLNHNDYGFD